MQGLEFGAWRLGFRVCGVRVRGSSFEVSTERYVVPRPREVTNQAPDPLLFHLHDGHAKAKQEFNSFQFGQIARVDQILSCLHPV